jgi:signal transduction histidine kinase
MREFARELRETQTSDGLRIALENLMRISAPGGVKAEVLFEGEEEHMPDYVRDQLYMILREGVRNAVAHSGADSIVVEAEISPREVTAFVWDHGPGFEASVAVTEGIRLSSMRERAELLNGSFEVTFEPDRGTVVKVPCLWCAEKTEQGNIPGMPGPRPTHLPTGSPAYLHLLTHFLLYRPRCPGAGCIVGS